MNNFNLGNRIIELRIKSNLSQEHLALLSEITPTYLRQIEHNKKNPTIYVISKICNSLNISISDFFKMDNSNQTHDTIDSKILYELQKSSIQEKEFILSMCIGLNALHKKSE